MKSPLPLRDGVGASAVRVPDGAPARVLDFLCAQFPHTPAADWASRLARGLVADAAGVPLQADSPCARGDTLWYYRELPPEPRIPFEAEILYHDAHLLVADKPHFLPVIPGGRYVQECLLVRLKRETGLADLVPLHRIDAGTAGLVVFSVNVDSRGAYQQLFPQRAVEKTYEAIAPAVAALAEPRVYRSRLEPGEPFFRMQEVPGAPNSETRIERLEAQGGLARYRLQPHTGRKHQLRVQLAALGAPILNDPLYPQLRDVAEDDFSQPLQLLAQGLRFSDPLSGAERVFESRRRLEWPPA